MQQMKTTEVAKDLFTEAQAAFNPIVGVPNDDDVKRLTEAFIKRASVDQCPRRRHRPLRPSAIGRRSRSETRRRLDLKAHGNSSPCLRR